MEKAKGNDTKYGLLSPSGRNAHRSVEKTIGRVYVTLNST